LQRICFIADTAGTYVFTASATDYCEATVEKSIVVRVALNQAPVVTLPPDTAIFFCGADRACFDWTYSDPENDSLTLTISGPAYVDTSSGQLCVMVDTDAEPIVVVVTATDPCGASGSDTIIVTPTFNVPPVVTLPADTSVKVCAEGEYCIGPVTISDADGNFSGDVRVEGGTYNDATGEVCVDVTASGTYIAIVTATDDCGAEGADTVQIDVTINTPPVTQFSVPDTSLYLCQPDTLLCFTFSATDPDGDPVVLNE